MLPPDCRKTGHRQTDDPRNATGSVVDDHELRQPHKPLAGELPFRQKERFWLDPSKLVLDPTGQARFFQGDLLFASKRNWWTKRNE